MDGLAAVKKKMGLHFRYFPRLFRMLLITPVHLAGYRSV